MTSNQSAGALTYLQHKLRQYTYRYKKFPDNPYFMVFDAMYALDASALPGLVRLVDDGYLHAEFIAPESKVFCGREISYFNAKRLAIFWLPGASHSGLGNGQEGEYSVFLEGAALSAPLVVKISKKGHTAKIMEVRAGRRDDKHLVCKLAGGFVIYSAIEVELRALIIKWLENCQSEDLKTSAILERAAKLPCPKIRQLVESLIATVS